MEYNGTFELPKHKIVELNSLLHSGGAVINEQGEQDENGTWYTTDPVPARNEQRSPAIYSGRLRFINNQGQPQVVCDLLVNGYNTTSTMHRNLREDIKFEFNMNEDKITFHIQGFDVPMYLYSVLFISTEKATGKEYQETELYAATDAFSMEKWAKAEAASRDSETYSYRFHSLDCITDVSAISTPMAITNGVHSVAHTRTYEVRVKRK